MIQKFCFLKNRQNSFLKQGTQDEIYCILFWLYLKWKYHKDQNSFSVISMSNMKWAILLISLLTLSLLKAGIQYKNQTQTHFPVDKSPIISLAPSSELYVSLILIRCNFT